MDQNRDEAIASSFLMLATTLWSAACMKMTQMYVGATKKAVNLTIQLRRLLEKGGFRLRKWYSNDREVLAAILESERAKSVVNV